MNHVNITLRDLGKFKQVTDEIVHFKRIRITLEAKELQRLKELIDKVKNYEDPSKKEKELKKLLENKKIGVDDYTSKIKELSKTSNEYGISGARVSVSLNRGGTRTV